MSRRLLLTGPDFPALESRAFSLLADDVGTQPESVLYLAKPDHPEDATKDRWNEVGPSAGIRVETIDKMAARFYKHDQYKGQVTHIDQPLLFRLVELGIEGISEPTNPLHPDGRFPRAGLVEGIPADHPATATLPKLRDDQLTDQYREYLDALASDVEASMQVKNPLADKDPAYEWWTDHKDEFDKAGTVAVLLIDALRFDLAQRLAKALNDSFDVTRETRVATLPSETKFGMAALTPGRAFRFSIEMDNETLTPFQGGRSLSTKQRRVDFLSDEGWEVPDDQEPEWGHHHIAYYDKEIDEVGEGEIGEMVHHFDDYVTELADTIRQKLNKENWDRIYVVTDHGFVLLPEGTTTEAVPSDAPNSEVKYRRVAGDDLSGLSDGVHVSANMPGIDYLDTDLQLLVDPRQHFSKQSYDGDRYYHGGLLPQECMLSFLEIQK